MPKESSKRVESSLNKRRVCEFDLNHLPRSLSDDVSSLLLTPLQWPRPLESLVSSLDLGSSFLPLRQRTKDCLHHLKRYEPTPICKLGLKHLCTTRQPDPESVTDAKLFCDSGEVVEERYGVTIHEVRVRTVMSIHHQDYGFVQVPGDVQAAGVNFFCRPTEFSVNAIGCADLARTELDTINTTYRQTFSAFNTFVCGITTVCFPTRWYSGLD